MVPECKDIVTVTVRCPLSHFLLDIAISIEVLIGDVVFKNLNVSGRRCLIYIAVSNFRLIASDNIICKPQQIALRFTDILLLSFINLRNRDRDFAGMR